jgi:hypothetical protein
LNPSNCSSAGDSNSAGATTIQANADTQWLLETNHRKHQCRKRIGEQNPTNADQLNGTAVVIGETDIKPNGNDRATPKTVTHQYQSIDVTTGIVSVQANTQLELIR